MDIKDKDKDKIDKNDKEYISTKEHQRPNLVVSGDSDGFLFIPPQIQRSSTSYSNDHLIPQPPPPKSQTENGHNLSTSQPGTDTSFLKETLTPSSPIGIYRRYSIADDGFKFRSRMAENKILKKLKVLEYVQEKRDEFELMLLKNGASQFIRAKDKLAFVLGVLNICILAFFYGRFPSVIPHIFAVEFILMFIARLYNYKQKKQHYFLFDFCYYANMLLIYFLYGTRRSPILFKICFSFCNGPLIWATVAWRNSLVFHSLDKATSVLIHMLPAVVCSALRWHIIPEESNLDKNSISTTWTDSLWIPLGFYLVWQTLYLYVMRLRKNTIKERNYITSLSFLTNHTGNHLIGKVLNILPTKKIYVFIISQFLYTILTILPTKLFYNNEYLHISFIFTMLVVCLWNGANYYVEFFSQHYVHQLKEKEERWKKIILSSNGNGVIVQESCAPSSPTTTINEPNNNNNHKEEEVIYNPPSPVITLVGDSSL